MSTKATIFLTKDNEHCYEETIDQNEHGFAIVMEFDKKNIEVLVNDDTDLIINIPAGSELWKMIQKTRTP